MFEFTTRTTSPPDGLFFERLDAFMDKCLADIKTFAEREYRPFEETRQYVAEWHSRYLFQPTSSGSSAYQYDSIAKVRSVLCDASRILESLCEVTGVQSFLLAVDPNNSSDMGFLGGSSVGREFWRGMRNGGEAGAKSFKVHCQRDQDSQIAAPISHDEGQSSRASSASLKLPSARSLKGDLYGSVRKALRSVSGIRNAEMKWTNPERLDVYGVRLVGWPDSIPAQNPSSLKAAQNRMLLDALENGSMRFEKLFPSTTTLDYTESSEIEDGNIDDKTNDNDDFSWAYDANAGDAPDVRQSTTASGETSLRSYGLQPDALHCSIITTDSPNIHSRHLGSVTTPHFSSRKRSWHDIEQGGLPDT